jgi:hypothetical protein
MNGFNPLGPWLMSNQYGLEIMDQKEKRFSSNPLKSTSYGDLCPVPKDLLQVLKDLKLAESEQLNETRVGQQDGNLGDTSS